MVQLPVWTEKHLTDLPECFAASEDRMRVTVDLAAENIKRNTGGPFAAAVFDMDSGKLISVGINCVVPANCSLAHAEMVALSLAQQKLQTFDLSSKGRFELATSCEPCAMCLGAIPWSGVRSVLCGASEDDARAVGFDEGDKPADWQQSLKSRGIAVTENILQTEAAQILIDYAQADGTIYNPSR
jgi:tRNA(Arg) A34 adenosine deaminase TadA